MAEANDAPAASAPADLAPADLAPAATALAATALADRVLAGEIRAGARAMRLVDDDVPLGREVLARLHRAGRSAELIGVTGAPGSGKSTLVDQLIAFHRARGLRVGVVAVDPSSPLSGGAVLADRVRMQRHTLDEGVFVRSVASRGAHGGLSASASATARVLEAMRFDVVLLETVGIGQSEVDIAQVADAVLVVLTPGMGDDVQAMKAGLLEVPDIFVVNKADREGADRVARDLEAMVHLAADRPWTPPVVKTIAATGAGVPELVEAIARHRAHLEADGGRALAERRRARARLEVEGAILARLRAALLARAGGEPALDAAAARVATFAVSVPEEVDRLLGRDPSSDPAI